jgi:pimeloyl-ACP methyl ester carboxylesterase
MTPAFDKAEAIGPEGARIVYERRGDRGPAIVFIHGWCCDRQSWRHQRDILARSHRFLFVDLAGHGESTPRARVSLPDYAADILAVLRAEKIDRALLVGHSMGGVVALHAASRAPDSVAGIIGVDTFKQPSQRLSAEQIDSMLAPMQRDFAASVRGLVRTRMFTPGRDEALAEQVAEAMAAQPPETGIAAQRSLLSSGYGELLREAAHLPLGLINADYVPTDIAALKERCPRIEITLIPGNSHFPMLERPSSFNPLLEAYIRRLGAASGLR